MIFKLQYHHACNGHLTLDTTQVYIYIYIVRIPLSYPQAFLDVDTSSYQHHHFLTVLS